MFLFFSFGYPLPLTAVLQDYLGWFEEYPAVLGLFSLAFFSLSSLFLPLEFAGPFFGEPKFLITIFILFTLYYSSISIWERRLVPVIFGNGAGGVFSVFNLYSSYFIFIFFIVSVFSFIFWSIYYLLDNKQKERVIECAFRGLALYEYASFPALVMECNASC